LVLSINEMKYDAHIRRLVHRDQQLQVTSRTAIENSTGNFDSSHLSSVSTDSPSIGPVSHVTALEGHSGIKSSLNMPLCELGSSGQTA
jgi:hypothetical protein